MTICSGHLRSKTIANQKLALQVKQTALKCLHVSLIANWALGIQQPNWIKRRDTSQQPYLFFCFLYSVFNHLTLSHLHHHELRVPFLIFSLSNCLITYLDSACSCVSLSMCMWVCVRVCVLPPLRRQPLLSHQTSDILGWEYTEPVETSSDIMQCWESHHVFNQLEQIAANKSCLFSAVEATGSKRYQIPLVCWFYKEQNTSRSQNCRLTPDSIPDDELCAQTPQ